MLSLCDEVRQRVERPQHLQPRRRQVRGRTKDEAEVGPVQGLSLQGRLEGTTGQQGLLLHGQLCAWSQVLGRNEARLPANLQRGRLLPHRLGLPDLRRPKSAHSARE